MDVTIWREKGFSPKPAKAYSQKMWRPVGKMQGGYVYDLTKSQIFIFCVQFHKRDGFCLKFRQRK